MQRVQHNGMAQTSVEMHVDGQVPLSWLETKTYTSEVFGSLSYG